MSKMGNKKIDDEDDDSGYDEWLMEQGYEEWLKNNKVDMMRSLEERAKQIKESRKQIAEARIEACRHVEDVWEQIRFDENDSDDSIHSLKLHDAIWYASTEILPALEVQAVIDSNNNIYVSTGTAGYVDYLTIDPSTLIGMKLPIRCWVHTHPFGAAYFSGTDWRTIGIWKENMECAYVLGSEMSSKGHYGFWSNKDKNLLEIYQNGEHTHSQGHNWKGGEEE